MKTRGTPWNSTSIQLWNTEEYARIYRRVWLPRGRPEDEVFRVEYMPTMQPDDGAIGDVEGPESHTPWDALNGVTPEGADAEGICEGPDAEEGPWFTAEELRAFTAAVLRHGGPYLDPLPLIPAWSVFASSLRAEGCKFVDECYPGWGQVYVKADALAINDSGCVFDISGVVCRDLSNGTRVEQSFRLLCFTGLPLWLKDVESTGPDDVWGPDFDKGRRLGEGND